MNLLTGVKMSVRYAIFCVLMCTLGCAPRELKNQKAPPVAAPPEITELKNFSAKSQRVTIMTWNMENLFDTMDDPDNDDEAFLPLELKQEITGFQDECKKKGAVSWVNQCLYWDWSEEVFNLKLERLSKVILSVQEGRGPDILVVQEIENLYVLQRLIDGYLPGLGYTAYLIENYDFRGIDVGIITRLKPVKEPALHKLRARPGLAMQFDLGNKQLLNVVAVHFPISPTPIEKRLGMLEALTNFKNSRANEFTIAAGDFNFPREIEQHYKIVDTYAKPNWIVSHLYCQPHCQGTFYDSFSSSWSQLDYILLSKNFLHLDTAWTIDPKSVRIHNPLDIQNTYDGLPSDFNLPNKKGVSDHWPLVMQIVKTDR